MRKDASGKFQAAKRRVQRLRMRQLLLRPAEEYRALSFEERLQRGRTERLANQGFLLADNVEIHQRQRHALKLQALAKQPAVDLHLRPVQLTVVGRHRVEFTAIGLHLFQLIATSVIAVRPAPYRQLAIIATQRQLGLVIGTAPRGDRAMPGNPLLSRG